MKYLLMSALSLSVLLLTSCTSNEGSLKKAALEAAEKQFAESVQKEADDNLTKSPFIHDGYIAFMKRYSEFEAEDVKLQGDSHGVVTVVIKTYSPASRATLLKIAGTVSESEARRFNFSNAYQLIGQQTGSPSGPVKQPFAVLSLKKDSSGEWRLLNQ